MVGDDSVRRARRADVPLLAEKFARRNVALAVALMLGLCTMMLERAVNLPRMISPLFGFGAWLAIEELAITPRSATLAGFLGGLAVLTEYESGIILIVLAGYLLVRRRERISWFVLGGTAPLAVLAWYQWRAFGAPWHTPSTYYAGVLGGTTRGGYSIPTLHDVGAVLFGTRGLLIGAPIAFVGIVGAIWLIVSGAGAARRHSIVALAVLVPYLVLCAGWSGLRSSRSRARATSSRRSRSLPRPSPHVGTDWRPMLLER